MAKYTQDQIDERIQKLPKALQEALFSPAIADKIFDIGNNNDLTIEQAGLLGEEVGNIILGFTKPEDFAKVLQEILQITETDAKKIAGEINQAVFVSLRDLLKSAHGLDIKGEAATQGAPVFMQKPVVSKVELPSTPPPELKPEWIIKPELKQAAPAPVSGIPPKIVLPEKEIQIPLPGSGSPVTELSLPDSPTPKPVAPMASKIEPPPTPKPDSSPVIDLKNAAPPKLPESTPPSKVPPIDLRSQAKPVIPEPAPSKPAPSVESPPSPPKQEPPPPPKAVPDKGVDLYREPIE